MIEDHTVEKAVALLEERGWERDDEMVADVRDALAAVQADLAARAVAEERHRTYRERARRQAERRRLARWRHVPPEAHTA